MAVGNAATDDPEQMKKILGGLPGIDGNMAECTENQKKEYLRWFDDAPAFESSDPLLDHTWWYRWFILRHSIARPDFGNFHHTLFYEGRSHKMEKEIFRPSGWEFSKLIPLSTPHHLTDSRWYGDGELSREALRSLRDSMDGNGLFRVLFTDDSGNEYSNNAGWALYLYFLVHNDPDFVREVLGFFKENTRGVCRSHQSGRDYLQIETKHPLTGKEYQPSYWYFHDYPDDVKDKSTYTPLKRVDRSIYVYLNALGIARLCGITGDPDEEEFLNLAENLRKEILEKMWDEKNHFFFDLHHETDEPALVKNIVGIYPLWAGITNQKHIAALNYLFDPEVFNIGSAFASTSRDCPVFSPEGGWKRQFIKGRNGCMWNGPSWPYTTAIALDTIAIQSKQNNLGLDEKFMNMLRAYCLQHFHGHDIHRPYLVEFYNSVTGEALSDEVDYNHSFFIDLIIRHIAGIEPEQGGFRFHPCNSGLGFFSLTNLKLQGHRVDVSYETNPKKENGHPAGFSVCIDGRMVYQSFALPKTAVKFSFT